MIPLEDFFRKPERAAVRLSPDGRRLAWLAPWQRRMNIHVATIDDRGAVGEPQRVTASSERDIPGYLWASDDRLVYVLDRGGDENWRLHAVGADGTNPLDLTPFDDVQCRLVDDLEDDPDHVLFEMNKRVPEVFDVYRLHVGSGEMTLVAENPGTIQSWITDHDGRIRLATTTDGVHTSILARADEDDPWRTVATYDFKESARPLAFTFDGDQRIWVSSNLGRDRSAICVYDLERGKELETIFEHPQVDVGRVLYSTRRRVLTGVVYETDRVGYRFFDERRDALQRLVDERLPGTENTIVSHARDESRWIVHAGSDRSLGGYHLVDENGSTVTHLFDSSPWLDPDALAPMRSIELTARDGLTLHGYLTCPAGREPRDVPLIVNPHGGPWHRDSWGFDPEVQFLASRGFAVLQVNFRGSTGYGRRFLEASFGQWGLAMQDDVTDAVRWAIDEGIADAARVAIYGGSYGGYATLAGLTKTPELYACGISYVGVSNLFTWIEAIPPYWKPYLEMMHEMVGHPERDEARFRATSPLFNVERIRAPLLVAQGANDPRVRKPESDQIVEALRARGVDVEYLVKDDEGHGFQKEENRFEFYRAMERFLDRHLPRAASAG